MFAKLSTLLPSWSGLKTPKTTTATRMITSTASRTRTITIMRTVTATSITATIIRSPSAD
jgi:hypothetical protein